MKKLTVCTAIVLVVLVFSYCTHSKKVTAASPVPSKITYETDVKPLVAGKCAPCHIPASGGSKKPYATYTSVKEDIDDIIHRISLNPGEHGFMPSRKAKLSDSAIMVFKQWKTDGLLEQ